MKHRIAPNLKNAIDIMRDACDEAERRIKDADGHAIQRVLHSLSWGFANASSSIETAMAALEDQHAVDLMKAEEA